jgi:hypothetical protein
MYFEQNLGQKIRDITELVDVFQAQEGEVQHIIGKTGNGKTYEGTRRALDYLRKGFVVYTTWKLILPKYYDERESIGHVFIRLITGKKRFYKFDYEQNWRYIDIDREDLVEYIASLTDCIVFIDEGQDIFDARGGMDKTARKTITRTRHMRKTLIIISQRAQAVDITARANITYFYKCVKTHAWWWPFKAYFKIYRTEDMDEQNYPVWEERIPGGEKWTAPLYSAHFADKKIYDAYNSWYLAEGKEKSQAVHFEAYDLNFSERIRAFGQLIVRPKKMPTEKNGLATGHLEEISRKKLSTGTIHDSVANEVELVYEETSFQGQQAIETPGEGRSEDTGRRAFYDSVLDLRQKEA